MIGVSHQIEEEVAKIANVEEVLEAVSMSERKWWMYPE
jgi:hypothetical protein